MPHTRKPTQADVARLANVSQAMVSYVLNAAPNQAIPPETRQRIQDAIAQLGYIPDRSARSLRTRRTRTLAVVLPDITNPYHPVFARGAQDAAQSCGYDVIIYNTDGHLAREQAVLAAVLQNNVDGLIAAFQHLKVEDLTHLTARGVALVLTEWYPHPLTNLPVTFASIDNAAATEEAVRYLFAQGRRRIAHIAGIHEAPPAEARLSAYRQTLPLLGLPVEEALIQPGDFSLEGGLNAMQTLLNLECPPDAVFCANDMSAIGAIEAIQQAGLSIPENIAVLGFDDIPAASIVRPRLSTVRTFQREIGTRAAQLLLAAIHDGPPTSETHVVMPHELIIRASA
jgi:LacI family transcriptional regulator